jgi:hypothetical protein
MLSIFRMLSIMCVAATTVSVVRANPLITTKDRQSAECLDRIHKRMRKLALIQLDEHDRCHRERMQGDLAPANDCNSPAGVVDPDRIEYWVARLIENSRVCNPYAAYPPVDQGFTACPAPCESIAVSDYAGVATCMACLTKLEISAAAETVFGTPPVPATREQVDCQRSVARAFARYFLERIESQKKCYLLQKYLRVDPSVDCQDADLSGRSARALERRARSSPTAARPNWRPSTVVPIPSAGNRTACKRRRSCTVTRSTITSTRREAWGVKREA